MRLFEYYVVQLNSENEYEYWTGFFDTRALAQGCIDQNENRSLAGLMGSLKELEGKPRMKAVGRTWMKKHKITIPDSARWIRQA